MEVRSRATQLRPWAQDLRVVFRDPHVLVVRKPGGVVTSGPGIRTLEHIVAAHVGPSNAAMALPSARCLHRLDGPVSGLVLFARTEPALTQLGRDFAERRVRKTYEALVGGQIEPGVYEHEVDGKHAITEVAHIGLVPSRITGVVQRVRLHPVTGRKHQLRLLCAAQGAAILGDRKYATGPVLRGRGLCLRSVGIAFPHPVTGQTVRCNLSPPGKWASLERWLSRVNSDLDGAVSPHEA